MINYKTIEEKAGEWNLSIRHIQYLCRTGKIEGAVKRAGAWFIPDDILVPSKNTKSNTVDFKFVGTKSKIFNSAIKLFMIKNFSNVSFKDIAEDIGVRQSTIYSHFRTKQEILDTIYDFYCYHFIKERMSLEDIEPKLYEESLMGIFGYIRYEFREDYRQKMSDITKIILQRIGLDDRAREIAKSLVVDESIKYVETAFNRAVDIGRLAPFDTHLIAVFINIVRLFTLFCYIVDPSPENYQMPVKDEFALYQYAAGLLTDLNPPQEASYRAE